MAIEIKRGLNLPIDGLPIQDIKPGPSIEKVAIIGDDFVGMRPTMLVNVGDRVKLGQILFTEKKTKGLGMPLLVAELWKR